MKRWLTLSLLLSSVQTHSQTAVGTTGSAEERGRSIAQETIRRDQGFGDSVTELTMTLRSSDGRETIRRLTWKTLEVNAPGAGDRSLTVFHEPRDIAGTAFLTHTYIGRDDDQWLYLPALKRVKRIASRNKSSAFFGSELAYEDLLSDEVEKFDYRWLRDEACDDWQCHVVERRPRYSDSGYSRQIMWIDRDEFRPVRIEYYDRKERLQKILSLEDYRRYLDKFWRAQLMRMQNQQTSKTTVLNFSEFKFRAGLGLRDFDPSALSSVR